MPAAAPTDRARGLGVLVGNTPLLAVEFSVDHGATRRIYAKAESLNLTGSIKDRMAFHILRRGYETGTLHPGGMIIEATSGNTGIALAMVGAALGRRVTILMSAGASEERRSLIRQLGAELILFDSAGRYQTGIEKSRAMAADAGVSMRALRVDGGAAANDWLMQFQSDLLGIPVVRPKVIETSALGAAFKGELFGVDVHVSSYVPTANAGADYRGMMLGDGWGSAGAPTSSRAPVTAVSQAAPS